MLSIGKKAAIAAALFWSCASVPATAATISNTYSGASYSNIAQFDPSLGTLSAITVDVFNGDARYHIKLDDFFEGPVSYSATAYAGVYLGPLYADGSLFGSGIAEFEDAEADIVLSLAPYSVNIPVPTDPSSFAYLTLIGTGTFAGSLTVDLPTDLVLGDHSGTNISEVSIVDRYAAFDLIYTYTPFGSTVPETSTWMMMLAGLALTAGALRKRPRSAPAAYQ